MYFLLAIVLFSSVSAEYVTSGIKTTEFVEPLKNITTVVGSNADFVCAVRHLGNSRIMWFRKRPGSTEEILAVNTLKITKSPKMSFSVLASSGIVTESILYIYNVGPEETGVYSCGVNTNPMIMQKGALDVFSKYVAPEPTATPKPAIYKNPTRVGRDREIPEAEDSESTIFCINFPRLWRDTKKEAEDFVSGVWKKLSSIF